MKIILLIFVAAIQVTTLQGLPVTCSRGIINRFMVMMPSPFTEGKWIFFPWPIRKTVIMSGTTAGNAEDMVVKNEYEKEDFLSKMDGKWMEEIKNFIADRYTLSNMIKKNFKIFGSKNFEKSEYLSKKEGEWLQEIKEYFRKKYLSPFNFSKLGSKTSIFREKPEKDDFWSKVNGKWVQEIRDHKKNKFSSEASGEFSDEKGEIEKIPNFHFASSEESEILSSEMPSLEKKAPKSSEEEENPLSEKDLPAEIKEKLGKIDKFLPESSKIEGNVDNAKKPFTPSSNKDDTLTVDISKFDKESGERIYEPEKTKIKIKEKVFVLPQKDLVKGKTSTIVYTSKNNKTQNSESDEKVKESYEKQENEKKDKLSVISGDEVEKKLDGMPAMACQKATNNNDAKGKSKNGKIRDSDESDEKWQESNESEEEVKSDKLSVVSENEREKIFENSGGSGESNNNFQGFGKLKVKFKKHKIPYGLAKKLQDQEIDNSGKWSKKPLKRFTSV